MSPLARILIINAGPLCRNPRGLKEATALGRAGYDVTVLGIATNPRFEAYDAELLRDAPFRKVAINLIPDQAAFASFRERAKSWLARKAMLVGLQPAAALGPCRALLQAARRIPSDLIIVHTEVPFCVGAKLLAEGRKVAADFEDWHSRDLLPVARRGRPLRLLAHAEGVLLRRAAYTTTTSAAMAAALHSNYGGSIPLVLPNTFNLQRLDSIPAVGAVPRLFWFSQTIGPGRGLEEFLTAWSQTTTPSELSLLGDIGDDYRDTLLKLLPPERRRALHFLPLVPPEELPRVIANHDIGLALEPPEPESRALTITNKILQYLNAGLAIVATPTPGQREVFAQAPDIGLLGTLSPETALAQKLEDLLSSPMRITAMKQAARRAAETHYNWEATKPILLGAVAGALATK